MPDPTWPTPKINFRHSRQAINEFRQSKPFHSGYNQPPRVQAITAGGPKLTSSIPSHSVQTKTYFLLSKPFQSCQKRLPLFQGQNRLLTFHAIPGRPKPTSPSPSHLIKAKTDLLHSKPFRQVKIDFLPSKPFQTGQNRLAHSKPFQSGQNQLPPFQAIPVRPKLTSSMHSDFLYLKPFQSEQYCQ
jgi:hypothetical protein